MGHNRISLRAIMGPIVMQDLGFAVMSREDGRRDFGCVELVCCAPILIVSNYISKR
jgi:hypothetical protein